MARKINIRVVTATKKIVSVISVEKTISNLTGVFLGVPKDILGDYNYWDQKIPPWGVVPRKHVDFTNETSKSDFFFLLFFIPHADLTMINFLFLPILFKKDLTSQTFSAVISVTTCGQTGRFGPTPELCTDYRNETGVEVLSDASTDEGDATLRSKGIQRWIAPRGGYYT